MSSKGRTKAARKAPEADPSEFYRTPVGAIRVLLAAAADPALGLVGQILRGFIAALQRGPVWELNAGEGDIVDHVQSLLGPALWRAVELKDGYGRALRKDGADLYLRESLDDVFAKAVAESSKGDHTGLRCVKCDAPKGTCTCWVTCACGWSHARDGKCNNPAHRTLPNPMPVIRPAARFRTAADHVVRLSPDVPGPVRFLHGKWKVHCVYDKTGGAAGWLVFDRLRKMR